jgi:hypothetical protein
VIRDEARPRPEGGERGAERCIALHGRLVEAIVRGSLLGHLPDAFDRVELRRVGRQAEQLDAVAMAREPELAGLVEVVAGAVVDDEKRLAASTPPDDLLEEGEERDAVEDRRELVEEPRSLFERDDAEDMRRLALAERVYAGLAADSGPRLVERPVEPEAGFVAVGNDASALPRFFLIAGSVSRSQVACRARSARARRLRGRCTENRSWCSSLGT